MSASLKPPAAEKVKAIIDNACLEDAGKVVGATICVVGLNGEPIFSHASGKIPKNDDTTEKRDVALNDLVRAFSCGKLLATICALQLVEQGKIDLDSPDFLEQYLPELKAKDRVFTHWSTDQSGKKQPEWKPRQTRVTVRMLLNHTSQLSNGMADADDADMQSWCESVHPKQEGEDNYSYLRGSLNKYYFHEEPGNFRYTGGIEWLGFLVERVAGLSLGDLYQQRIIGPLGMSDTKVVQWFEALHDTTRFLTPHMRLPGDTIITTPIPEGKTFTGGEPDPSFKPYPESDKHAYIVSMSVLTNPSDYCKILAALLNDGVSPTTGATILSKESVAAMVKPQLKPEQFQKRLATDLTAISIPLDLARLDPSGNVGLACAVQGDDRVMPNGKRGRSKGTAYWYGLANSHWWVDFEKQIAVFATSHILPWNDPPWVEMMDELEGALYEGLA